MEATLFKALPPLPTENEKETAPLKRWKRAFGLVKAKARSSNVSLNNDSKGPPRATSSLGHNVIQPIDQTPSQTSRDANGTATFDYAYHYDSEECYHRGSSSSVLDVTVNDTEAYNEQPLRKRQGRRLPIYRHSLASGFLLSSSSSGSNIKKETCQANRMTIASPPAATLFPDQTATAITEAAGKAAALTRQAKRQRKKEERAKRKELAGLTYAYAYGYGGLLQQRQQGDRPGTYYCTHTQRESQLSSRPSIFSWEERNNGKEVESRIKEGENVYDSAADGIFILDDWNHEHRKRGCQHEHEPNGNAHQQDLDYCHQSDQEYEHGRHCNHENGKDLSRRWKPSFRSRSLRKKSVRKAARSRSRSRARQARLQRQSITSTRAEKQLKTSNSQSFEDGKPGRDAEKQFPTSEPDKQTGQNPLPGLSSKGVVECTATTSEARLEGGARHRQEVAFPHDQRRSFGLGIILDNNNRLPSTLADRGLTGGSIKRSPSQSKSTTMLASISRQQPQPQAQAPTLDSSTGVNPASLPITNRRDNRKASEISFCNYCFFSDCNSAVAKYQHDNGYPPVPMRHPGHRHVAAVKSAMSSSYRCIQESTATSASVLNVTTPPTPRKPNSGQSRNRGPSTADNTNRDPDSACSGHRHSCTGTAASAEIVTGLVTTAAKPAICKQHKGWLDSWQLIHEVNHVDDSGDNAEKQISPTHPCRHSQGPTELHLPSHKASRFPRSCSACRPGTSVAVIQQHKKHEWQNYCPDVFKADVECQLGVISLPNSDADAESSRVFELPNVASQQDSHREFNREDKAPSRYNHGYGHPYDLYGDYSQKHVERSRFVPSTGRRETAKHGDSIPNPSIPQVNKIRSQTSVFGNIKNCREKNESVASGSGAADTMITTAFGSDRNQFPRTSNQSIRLSHYSRDICDCTVAEAAYVHFSGSIYSQAYREDSHDNTRGNIRQSMEDVRYKSFKSHPTQMSISKGPFPPRAASCSSVSTTNHSNSRFINVQIATDNRLQRNHGSGEKSSQPHVKNPANTQLYDQEFSPIVSSDEKPSHSQHSSPFKAPVSRCCSNGRKLKKSVSLSPLLLGKGLSEMARGKRIEGKTGSPQSLPYRFKAAQERWQSADCSGLSPWLTAQKRMKDLHRKASVSHLKINLLGETMGEVSFPIYSGSASSTSSHLYYSCNEEAMPNESAETAQSYGKDGGNCILTPLSRHSPFIPEYESSSDPSTSDEEELEIHDVKIESAQRVRHRRVDAVEIKEIDIKPRQGPHPPPKPSQTSGSPVFKLLPDNIPRRRLKRRNIEALNRFPPRRTASEPSHSPTSVSEKERLSHSASFTTISKRPALRRAEPYVRQCHSLPASNLISPTFNCMTEDEIATLRDRMQSSSSTSSGQSSWSQNSNASENSLRTFVDLKDASFVFN